MFLFFFTTPTFFETTRDLVFKNCREVSKNLDKRVMLLFSFSAWAGDLRPLLTFPASQNNRRKRYRVIRFSSFSTLRADFLGERQGEGIF